jgi:ribosomal-protein-alanine N-acetyltransferase
MDGWLIDALRLERDLDDVLELEGLCFTNPSTRDMLTWEAERSDVTHAYVLSPSPERVGMALRDGRPVPPRIVGYCSVWLIFEELHINTLAIHPDWRRAGLASGLIRHVLADAVRQGAEKATLEVRRSNEAARRLYERFGFETTAVRTSYYRDPVEDALILWRHRLAELAD